MNTRETLIKIAELVSDLSYLVHDEDGSYMPEYEAAFPPEGECWTYQELKKRFEMLDKSNGETMRKLFHKTNECVQKQEEINNLKKVNSKLRKTNQELIAYIKNLREISANEKVENANNL